MKFYASYLDRDDYEQEKHIALLTGRNVHLHWIDVTRKATKHRNSTKLQMVSYDGDLHDQGYDSTLERVLESEEIQKALDGIRNLPEPWARCLLLKIAGYSREEIAEREGIGWKSVDNYVTKARRHLRVL